MTRKREIRADGGNHHEKLGLQRISCASRLNIANTAGTSPDPACNYTDTRSLQPNQAGPTPDFSYPLVSSTSFSSSSLISLFSFTTLYSLQNTKLSHPSLFIPCHDRELTPSPANPEYSRHRGQHTPSTAYTEYSIHRRLFAFPSVT